MVPGPSCRPVRPRRYHPPRPAGPVRPERCPFGSALRAESSPNRARSSRFGSALQTYRAHPDTAPVGGCGSPLPACGERVWERGACAVKPLRDQRFREHGASSPQPSPPKEEREFQPVAGGSVRIRPDVPVAMPEGMACCRVSPASRPIHMRHTRGLLWEGLGYQPLTTGRSFVGFRERDSAISVRSSGAYAF